MIEKIRLENEAMIDELCRKIYENDDDDLVEYDDNYEIADGYAVKDLKLLNKTFGDGALLVEKDEYEMIMNFSKEYLDTLYIDLTKVVNTPLTEGVWCPVSVCVIDVDKTLKIGLD